MKNIPKKCFERAAPIWASNFNQLNAWHSTGRCVTTALEKECITFSCFFSDCHSPLPSKRTQGIFQGITLTRRLHNAFPEPNLLIRNDAEFAKNHEKGALPELLEEYFLPALSPKSAKATLLQQDTCSPVSQTQIYRSKTVDPCQKWKK